MNRTRAVSRLAVAGVVLAASAVSAAIASNTRQELAFPHPRHAGLFPLCTGCHEGVPANDQARLYPPVSLCNQCHVGDEAKEDTWTARGPRAGNLRFRHGSHEEMFGDFAPTCEGCHAASDEDRMAVTGEIRMETCWTCHPATDHQVDAPCATCHVPLGESGLPVDRIAAFPFPGDHGEPTWLLDDHGARAVDGTERCAVCHTRSRCLACHVDGARDPIQAMPPAPPGMELPPTYARYMAPSSHESPGWLAEHQQVASRAACGTCHTSDGCMACHVPPGPAAAGSLVSAADAAAPGVVVARHAPDSHGSPFFMKVHPVLAASDQNPCSTCHVESFCVGCHDAAVGGGYHPSGFVARHSADAFGRQAECANCHDVQVFCRSCHVQVGLTSVGRMGPGYHEGGGVWLLRHGQAARQNLESCTSCHKQNDCTQCHGVLGAFKVSPHSRDFDARRAWEQSPRTCFACHIKNPMDGGAP